MTILADVKKALGIAPEYPAFDIDILLHMNSACMELEQLGLKLSQHEIAADTDWSYFANADTMRAVKQYLVLSTRLAFDPPVMSFQVNAIKDRITELQWRLAEQYSQNGS